MKDVLIFLDFDGVLNSESTGYGSDKYRSFKNVGLDKKNILNFYRFLQELEKNKIKYNIFLETAWCMNKSLSNFKFKLLNDIENEPDGLEKNAFKEIISRCTDKVDTLHIKNLQGNPKAPEIEYYLMRNNIDTRNTFVVIIDDEYVGLKYYDNYMYMTSQKDGLTMDDNAMLIYRIKENIKKEEF